MFTTINAVRQNFWSYCMQADKHQNKWSYKRSYKKE